MRVKRSKDQRKAFCGSRWTLRKLILAFTFILLSSYIVQLKNTFHLIQDFNKAQPGSASSPDSMYDKTRYITVVMPSVVNQKDDVKRLKAISRTWGPSARAIFVMHDATKLSDLPILKEKTPISFSASSFQSFPMILPIPTTITEEEGVERLKYVIQRLTTQIQPDFLFFVNDHTFVIPEQLCHFLTKHKPTDHLYAGHALKNDKEEFGFNSGAAGYVLSRHTSESLMERWDANDPNCSAPANEKWLQNNPGLVTAKCLHDSLNVHVVDTRPPDLSHIFHAFGIVRTVTGNVDNWYIGKHRGFTNFANDYKTVLSGSDCCGYNTVSFHYVESYETYALFDIREQIQHNPLLLKSEIKDMIQRTWPDNKDNGWVGGYGRPLPKDSDEENWDALLDTFRKISNPHSACNPS